MRTDIHRKHRRQSEQGWALVSVLWAMIMLSLMAAATQDLTLISHKSERGAWDAARAEAALHAGLIEAVSGIAASSPSQRWRVDGVPRDVTFEGFKLMIAVQAESGRFDLNAADEAILETLIQSAGGSQDQAKKLAASILYWRTPSSELHPLDAALEDDYAAAGLSYRPRHGPFQTVEELRLVLGISPDLFAKLSPALTVYTKQATINPVFAPREALLALYGGDEDQVDAIIAARNSGAEIPSQLYLNSSKSVIAASASTAGQTFAIVMETRVGRKTYRKTVVVMLTGDDARPYLTLTWGTR